MSAKPIRALILSHTQLGSGLCTNLMVFIDGKPRQIRPRMEGAGFVKLTYPRIGLNTASARGEWQAGRYAWITPRVRWERGRPTHPEDMVLPDNYVFKLDTERERLDDPELIEKVTAFTHDDIKELFPEVSGLTHKPFVQPQSLPHSVGYVRMKEIRVFQDWGKWRVELTCSESGVQRVCHVALKSEELLRSIDRNRHPIEGKHEDVVLRLALAGPFTTDDGFSMPCYVMCSDILWRDDD